MALYQIVIHRILDKAERTNVHRTLMAKVGGNPSWLSPQEKQNRFWRAMLQGVKENPWVPFPDATEFVLEKYPCLTGDWAEMLGSAVRDAMGQNVQIDVSDVTRLYGGLG
jgi:hypothetical protein